MSTLLLEILGFFYRRPGVSALWLAVALTCVSLPARAAELVWKEETFTKTTFEEDVKVILREVLQRNGQEVYFRPGVEGEVTFDFSRMPLQAAFNKLIEEQALRYTYNEPTNTVTIEQSRSVTLVDEIFTPKYSALTDILAALKRFGLMDGEVRIKPDHGTNALFLQGGQARVADLKRIAGQIDEAYKNRREKDRQDLVDRLKQADADADKAIEVKVIPLRFANVGPSKTSFQGEQLTLPGIIDSLRAFVGSLEVRDTETGKSSSAAKDELSSKPWDKPTVSIDQRTNSVIVQGTAHQIERIANVVAKLDKPVPLVEIEVMIVDGLAAVTRQLGVDWGYNIAVGPNAPGLQPAASVISGDTVNSLALTPKTNQGASSTVTSLETGTQTTSTAAVAASTVKSGVVQVAVQNGLGAGFIYQGTRALLDAKLDAMARDDKLQTIASPRVVTLNNLSAKITNSNNINFVVTTGDGTKSDIQTVSSGMSLDITPSVIRDYSQDSLAGGKGYLVRLEINAKNSTPGEAGASSVTTNDQEVQTNVIIPDGKTFIMGGLFNTTRVEGETGVPYLKEIPILGGLFRTNTSQDQKRETVFFITPKVYESTVHSSFLPVGYEEKGYMERQKGLLDGEKESLRTRSRLLTLPAAAPGGNP